MKKIQIRDLDRLFPELFKFISSCDIKEIKEGKYCFERGAFVIVKEYMTNRNIICNYESHIKFIDIHYYLNSGEGIALFNAKELTMNSINESNDIITYNYATPKQVIYTNKGDAVFLDKDDAHMCGLPNLKESLIKS